MTIFDLNADLGNALAAEIGGRFAAVNVADPEAVQAALVEAESEHGVGRVLVNCAGIGVAGKTVGRHGQPYPLTEFTKTLTVNLIGSFNVLSQFAVRLCAAEPIGEERGVIINTASVAAFDGQIG